MLKKWADEIALTLRLKRSLHSDSAQLFEDRDNPTSNVFIEVCERFIDKNFTETAEFVHCNHWLRLGVSRKLMLFQASSNALRTAGLIVIPTSSASIWDRQGLRSFLRQAEHP